MEICLPSAICGTSTSSQEGSSIPILCGFFVLQTHSTCLVGGSRSCGLGAAWVQLALPVARCKDGWTDFCVAAKRRKEHLFVFHPQDLGAKYGAVLKSPNQPSSIALLSPKTHRLQRLPLSVSRASHALWPFIYYTVWENGSHQKSWCAL